MRSSMFVRAAVRVSLVAVFAAGLSLAACGPGSSSGNKNLVIGTLLPVSGTDAGVGLPTQYGVDLAVSRGGQSGG